MREYKSFDEDNGRWTEFEFRDDDIVIASPSKSGTTWTQLLVALLIFDGPDFPASIGELSPWMDHRIAPVAEVHAALEQQENRRFIKTHTPLDGIPIHGAVTYVCVGRDPRDAAVSMRNHHANMDQARRTDHVRRQLDPGEEVPPPRSDASESDYFDTFIKGEGSWSLTELARHHELAWHHRNGPNIELFHYADYSRDLTGEMMRLAEHLGYGLDHERATLLAAEAAFDRVKQRAADIVPEAQFGIWREPRSFFASGTSGQWRDRMSEQQVLDYEQRAAELMSPELNAWVHFGRAAPRDNQAT